MAQSSFVDEVQVNLKGGDGARDRSRFAVNRTCPRAVPMAATAGVAAT